MSFESLIEKAVAKNWRADKTKTDRGLLRMNHLKLFLIGLCVLAGIFLLTSCANQPAFCPEVTVSFCPVK